MKINKKSWTKEELKAYLLLFCASSDYAEVSQDLNILRYKIGRDEFNAVSKEFDKDNDYQSIQKICSVIEEQGYSREQLHTLFQEIKELFLSGGRFNNVKRTMFMGFKRILIAA